MTRPSAAFHSLLSVFGGLALLAAGCTDNQIGRICNNPSSRVTNGVTFVNPAPDCPSRLCMITPPSTSTDPVPKTNHTTQAPNGGELAVCTAECNSDDDCASQYAGADSKTCGKYVCAVASVVPGEENFCCKKLCMCDADLQEGFNKDSKSTVKLDRDEFNVPIPTACKRANACKL